MFKPDNQFAEFGERKKYNVNYFMEHIAYLQEGWVHLNKISAEAKARAQALELGLHSEKPKEENHEADPFGRNRRFKWGPRCEASCMDAFCILSSFDSSVGDSRRYGHADFKRLGVGVKSAQFGSCPMVFQEPDHPEIIMSYTDLGDLYICGLATVDIQRKYSSLDGLNDINPALKPYKPKLAFYGYDQLIPLHDYMTIPKLKGLLEEL